MNVFTMNERNRDHGENRRNAQPGAACGAQLRLAFEKIAQREGHEDHRDGDEDDGDGRRCQHVCLATINPNERLAVANIGCKGNGWPVRNLGRWPTSVVTSQRILASQRCCRHAGARQLNNGVPGCSNDR